MHSRVGPNEVARKTKVGFYSGCSACFIWSSIEAKKRHSALAEAIAPLSVRGSPKETISATEYWRRRRSVRLAVLVLPFGDRKLSGRRPLVCLMHLCVVRVCLVRLYLLHLWTSTTPQFEWITAQARRSRFLGEGCKSRKPAAPAGQGFLRIKCGYKCE